MRIILKQKLILALTFTIGILFIIGYTFNSKNSYDNKYHVQLVDSFANVQHVSKEEHLKLLEEARAYYNENSKLKNRLKQYDALFQPQKILTSISETKKTQYVDLNNNIINSNDIQIARDIQLQNEQKQNEDLDYNTNILKFLDKIERLVHIDLKGAPPKITYFKEFFKLIKNHGATGILLEYEDMFPFEGSLKAVRHGNAYSIEDIQYIIKLAELNGLKIMPLVQTYGHLEWVLKHKNFAHLREHKDYPQVITPCLEESYSVIFEMIDQVVKMHPNVPYFHIGCDEVYYKLVNENCTYPNLMFDGDFSKAFMNHTLRVAAYVRSKLPKAKVIIWNDMLQNIDMLNNYKDLVRKYEIEPMIWAYVEDVERWFNDGMYTLYGEVFENVWAASAYKGSSGELTTITSIEHQYLNQLSWNRVMYYKTKQSICKFRGVAITGWSRYDHFLAPCDLLPQAIPALIHCLVTAQYGQITEASRVTITTDLGCNALIPFRITDIYETYITCTFPGHEIYEVILTLKSITQTLDENMEFAKKYMTPISIKYNYAHASRAREVIPRLEYSYDSLIRFRYRFIKACTDMYWNETITEWLEVYLTPQMTKLHDYIKDIKTVMKTSNWEPRPLPIKPKEFPDFVY